MARAGVPVPTAGTSVGELLAELEARLPGPEARWVVATALGVAARNLALGRQRVVPEEMADVARSMAARCLGGEPLQYVLGTWAFRDLEVVVDPRVLVPRPETEHVVGVALEELGRAVPSASPPVALDLGTGSGVIALSLAHEGPPGLEVWAVDASPAALEVAERNLACLVTGDASVGGRVHLVAGSWFESLPPTLAGRVQLVVSNPPYVSADEWHELDPVVRDHEPYEALVSGPSGLEALLVLVDGAPHWLAPGGALVAELAPHQADEVAAAARHRSYGHVEVRPDLTGRLRVLVARMASSSPSPSL